MCALECVIVCVQRACACTLAMSKYEIILSEGEIVSIAKSGGCKIQVIFVGFIILYKILDFSI